MKLFLILIISISFISCGADRLKSNSTNDQSNLTAGHACSCTVGFSPVCGNDGKNYDNSCLSQCFGTTIKNTGHCDCTTYSTLVCGIDGADHTECEAKNANINIVKFIPCASSEI